MFYARIGKSPLRLVGVFGVLWFVAFSSNPASGGEPEDSISFNLREVSFSFFS